MRDILYKTRMNYFGDLTFYRFNHLRDHREVVDRSFSTFAVNYAHRGELIWSVEDGESVTLTAPVAYWTWPDARFRYRPVGAAPWEHFFISFRGKRPQRWAAQGLFPITDAPYQSISEPKVVRDGFGRLINRLASVPPDDPFAVHLLEGLLLTILRQPKRVVTHPRHDDVMAITRQINADPAAPFDVHDAADSIAVSAPHLRRLFGSIVGVSPTAYVMRARLNQAAAILRQDDTPIKNIAIEVGIKDVYYFSRLFRRQFDMPPAAYRRSFQRLGEQ